MNQDDVKSALLKLHAPKAEFTLIFSGKVNHRVNGLYHPETREIIIHNRNFTSDNAAFYTAMHEYAHHIMATEKGAIGTRAHTNAFWATLHELAGIAEEKGLYAGAAKSEAMAEVNTTLSGLITQSGEILKAIGRALIEAQGLCEKNGVRFEDYVMRNFKQTLSWATMCMKAAGYDLPPELGAENIKMVASMKSEDDREAATEALEGDLSSYQVKVAQKARNEPEDVAMRLKEELNRITRTITRLTERKIEVSNTLETITSSSA